MILPKSCSPFFVFFVVSFLCGNAAFAQNIGVNSTGAAPDNSAMLDISAVDKGILVPRVALSSTSDAAAIPDPATSLLIWNTNPSITGGTGAGRIISANTGAALENA